MHLAPPKAARRLGFTLLELMVVLVLIGIMSLMILPEMKGTFENALLRSASRDLINVFNVAYSRAVSVNNTHRVRLDLLDGRYFVEAAVPGTIDEFMPIEGIQGAQGKLDKRILITLKDPTEMAIEPSEQPDFLALENPPANRGRGDCIAFYPDGTADRREIHLEDREGFRLSLQINPVTARVRIVEMERK